jgi:hypothetical protein
MTARTPLPPLPPSNSRRSPVPPHERQPPVRPITMYAQHSAAQHSTRTHARALRPERGAELFLGCGSVSHRLRARCHVLTSSWKMTMSWMKTRSMLWSQQKNGLCQSPLLPRLLSRRAHASVARRCVRHRFPAYKDCSCCKGYIHDCEAVTCQSLGTFQLPPSLLPCPFPPHPIALILLARRSPSPLPFGLQVSAAVRTEKMTPPISRTNRGMQHSKCIPLCASGCVRESDSALLFVRSQEG